MEKESITTRENAAPKDVSVVPTPVGTHWREFRIKYLPPLVFGITIALIWTLWRDMPPSGLRGIGEGPVATLASPQDGFIRGVAVQPREWIEAGQSLLTVVPYDPGARLDVLQSQLQLSRLSLEPSVTDRNAINYEQLRVDALRLRQELAMARANLSRAERTLPRHEALVKERLLSQDIYDLTLRDRDFYKAQVEETEKALTEIDGRLEQLRSLSEPAPATNVTAAQMLPHLENQMTAIETNWNPVTLTAPISGEVSFYRSAGEFVRAGDLLAVIHSPRANHVVAYLKQPMAFQPEVGMPMEVITRSLEPQRFLTEISRVGARVEVITNALAYVPAGALVDSGLPLVLPVPDTAQVRPGEVVDINWRPAGTNTGFFQRFFGIH